MTLKLSHDHPRRKPDVGWCFGLVFNRETQDLSFHDEN